MWKLKIIKESCNRTPCILYLLLKKLTWLNSDCKWTRSSVSGGISSRYNHSCCPETESWSWWMTVWDLDTSLVICCLSWSICHCRTLSYLCNICCRAWRAERYSWSGCISCSWIEYKNIKRVRTQICDMNCSQNGVQGLKKRTVL